MLLDARARCILRCAGKVDPNEMGGGAGGSMVKSKTKVPHLRISSTTLLLCGFQWFGASLISGFEMLLLSVAVVSYSDGGSSAETGLPRSDLSRSRA